MVLYVINMTCWFIQAQVSTNPFMDAGGSAGIDLLGTGSPTEQSNTLLGLAGPGTAPTNPFASMGTAAPQPAGVSPWGQAASMYISVY